MVRGIRWWAEETGRIGRMGRGMKRWKGRVKEGRNFAKSGANYVSPNTF
jgi:hypothetical protein